jgi:molybdenum cofactor cytidylyltransferase
MRAQTVDIQESAGRILSTTIFRPGGKKLMAKGHLLRAEDIRALEMEGMTEVWVAELEEGEIPEDEAVWGVTAELACGSYRVEPVSGGRANLVAAETVCTLVDEDLLREVNGTAGLVIATTLNFSMATRGQRIATVKSAPFAVSRADFEKSVSVLREKGPVLQARPMQAARIGVVYCDPLDGERARTLFEPILRQKLERFGVFSHHGVTAVERDEQVSRSIQYLVNNGSRVVLIASTTAPAGPDDTVGRAMTKAGCPIECYLAPVEPGHLLLLGYKNEIPVVSAPGCFRSLRTNVVDLLLPPMMAHYRISRWEVACLGHGGLLDG